MRKLKTKTVPCMVMLLGGAVTLTLTYLNHYPSRDTLMILLISLMACYFVGTLVKTALDQIEILDEESVEEMSETESEEGEMAEEPEMDGLGELEDSMDGSNEFVLDENDQETDLFESNTEEVSDEEYDDFFDDSSILS